MGVVIVHEGANQPATGGWDAKEQLLVEPYIKGRELTVGVMSRPGEAARFELEYLLSVGTRV